MKDFDLEKHEMLIARIQRIYKDHFDDELYISKYSSNDSYKNLTALMIEYLELEIKDIPGGSPFIKFFNNIPPKIHPASYSLFRKFANKYEAKNKLPLLLNITFIGADIINIQFVNKILTENQHAPFSAKAFYLEKLDESCQWYGIINTPNWDVKRREYDNLKKIVKESFKSNSSIAAVVCGSAGSGKTTLLRRLAIDCKDFYCVLWVNNTTTFITNIESLKNNISTNYLVFIDHWGKLKLSPEVLYEISKLKNVRLIIADLDTRTRPYLEYLNESNIISLLHDENEDIIKAIVEKHDRWRDSWVLEEPEFYSTSLHIIISALANEVTRPIYKYTATQSERTIIRNDLEIIYKSYPGLAKAIFYFANLCINHHFFLTWQAFLAIADFYNKDLNTSISKELDQIDMDSPIGKVLVRYFWIKKIINPLFGNSYFFRFHNQILINGVIQSPINDTWHYSKKTKYEILDKLIELGEIENAESIYHALWSYTIREEPELDNYEEKVKVKPYRKLYLGVYFDHELTELFSNAKVMVDEYYWQHRLIAMVMHLRLYYEDEGVAAFKIIIKKLINCGCKSPTIKKVYKASKKNDKLYLRRLVFSILSNKMTIIPSPKGIMF